MTGTHYTHQSELIRICAVLRSAPAHENLKPKASKGLTGTRGRPDPQLVSLDTVRWGSTNHQAAVDACAVDQRCLP